MANIYFLLRQSDEDLACFSIHDSQTILKFYLDEHGIQHLMGELNEALAHIVKSRELNQIVADNLKKTRFPRERKARVK